MSDNEVLEARLAALDARVEKIEANMGRAVMGLLGVAFLLIWEPLKAIVTGANR